MEKKSSTGESTKNIWEIALEASQQNKVDQTDVSPVIAFVGGKTAGKTSLINRFLDRDEAPKPTVALEYTYSRRAKGNNTAKDLAHIWELGGGTWLSKLVDIPLQPESLQSTVMVIVVDLSQPDNMWLVLEKYLSTVRQRVDALASEVKQRNPELVSALKEAAWDRIGPDHVDHDMLDPFPIPLAIFCSKYDLFQDFESEKRKVICRTLRFIAHMHGTYLVFYSLKQETLMNKARSLLGHLLFNTSFNKYCQVDYSRPMLVTPGQDSLESIGPPPVSQSDVGRLTAKTPMELWKVAFCSVFPQQSASDPSLATDPTKDNQYAETQIDNLRKQKEEELERYRRAVEKRAREAAQRSFIEA